MSVYQIANYWRLARFDKPVGILLLWFPTAWALWIANQGHPSVKLIYIFALGTVVMRSAGCILNDMADRKYDGHVERTQCRPLATGEISVFGALGLAIVFLLIALGLLFQLSKACIPYAVLSILVTIIYPFCKRFIHAPQLVLGIAFSMGIPMAYVASDALFDHFFWIICLINFLWIVAYDTEYAIVDKEDDRQIGVKSTALWFGDWDLKIVYILLTGMHVLWLLLAYLLDLNVWFYGCWCIGAGLLIRQYWMTENRIRERVMQAFLSNCGYGFVMWMGLLLGG